MLTHSAGSFGISDCFRGSQTTFTMVVLEEKYFEALSIGGFRVTQGTRFPSQTFFIFIQFSERIAHSLGLATSSRKSWIHPVHFTRK